MIKTALIIAGLIFLLLRVDSVWATPALDIKSNPLSVDQQKVEEVSPPPSQNTVRTQTPVINRSPANQKQAAVSPSSPSEEIQNLQTQLQSLKDQVQTLANQSAKPVDNQRTDNWFSLWRQVGFFTGILWILLWIFVGLQWAKLKFWDFGWPWPWWFWIPLVWFIPWLIVGWWWWLDWWDWWIWIWWIFPWVFWLFWWIILFKESTIWVWHRRKSSSITTE